MQPRPGGLLAVRRALAYLRGYQRDAAGAVAALLLVAAANLITPQLVRVAIDVGYTQAQPSVLAGAVAGLVGVALVRGLFTFLQGYLAERASQGVAYELREALFAQIERLSFSYYDRAQTGQLVTRGTNDVEQVRTFVGTGVIQLVASLVLLVGTALILGSINLRLTIAALLTRRADRVVADELRPPRGSVVWAGPATPRQLEHDPAGGPFRTPSDPRVWSRGLRARALWTGQHTAPGAQRDDRACVVEQLPAGLLFRQPRHARGHRLWRDAGDGRLPVDRELIAFNSYLAFLLQPILTIGFLTAAISRAGASALRIFDVLDAPIDIQDQPGARPLPSLAGEVIYDQVSFRYPGADADVLCDVSFSVQPGQTVAILGTTGAGKSTLINLLPRFYDVTGGSVRIDGHDVRDVTLDSLRCQISIVLQDALLFGGSVRDNIAYGKPDATQAEIEAAARAAQAHAFITELPQGYETIVGERGIGLSGGQRQRLAIARALLVDPCLLILDDSTSAVDAETEAAIRDALERLIRARRRTVFTIAQRISTVRDADLILVLDDGGVAAMGRHEDLLRDSELYNQILGSQLREEPVATPA